MTTSNKGFRHDIEGLRALAVLLVIAFHARILNCQGGFIGVDVFFVLSGYLITGLLVEEVLQTGKLLLVPFYARRIRRLLPASTAMLLGVVIGARFILPPIEQSALSASVQATSAYLSNAYFARISSDYFGPDVVGNALLHTWSLAVEEQFYFVWPLLILFASQVRRSRGAFSLVMLVVGAVSLAASVWLTSNNQPWAFFSMPPRAWEFAVGGAASQISAEWLRNYRWSIRVLGWAGLIVVVASGFWLSPIGFPGIKAVLPVLGTAAVLICGAIELRGGPMVILSAKPLQYVGQRSYALYLWHWPLLVYASVLSEPSSFLLRLACVGAAFVLAELTKLAIENPIRFNPYLRSQSMLCVSTSVLVMFAGVAGGAV